VRALATNLGKARQGTWGVKKTMGIEKDRSREDGNGAETSRLPRDERQQGGGKEPGPKSDKKDKGYRHQEKGADLNL